MLMTKFELHFEKLTFFCDGLRVKDPLHTDNTAAKLKGLAEGFADLANKGIFDFDDAPEHANDFKIDPDKLVTHVAKRLHLSVKHVEKNIDSTTGSIVVTLHVIVPI